MKIHPKLGLLCSRPLSTLIQKTMRTKVETIETKPCHISVDDRQKHQRKLTSVNGPKFSRHTFGDVAPLMSGILALLWWSCRGASLHPGV